MTIAKHSVGQRDVSGTASVDFRSPKARSFAERKATSGEPGGVSPRSLTAGCRFGDLCANCTGGSLECDSPRQNLLRLRRLGRVQSDPTGATPRFS